MPLLMECTTGAPPEDADAITAGLVAFNRQASGQPASEPLTVIVRDPASREVRGGLRGKFTHAWLHVNQLWLADELRGSGLGAEILGLAEEEAMRRRCVGVHLDTFDFQAPGFYERLGYEVFGVVEDHPRDIDASTCRSASSTRWLTAASEPSRSAEGGLPCNLSH